MPGTWVVVPAFNEAENLQDLIPRIVESLTSVDSSGTVLVVDDGSTDTTLSVMADLQLRFESVRLRRVVRNRGKAAALQAGFKQALDADASVLVMMDADGQDDPCELPRLLKELLAGSDVVTGARLERQDRFTKKQTSRVFNRVTRSISGAPGRDFNSGYKVFTAEVARAITPMLYGELHRYITVIAHWLGYRIAEVPVAHHERLNGKTKYGVARFWRGFIDLLTVRFLMSYEHRPSHLFGGIGLSTLVVGTLILGYLTSLRLMGETVGGRPLLIAGVLLVVTGLQLLLFGLLAELTVYTRHHDGYWDRNPL